jgi:hypothetical protein
MYMINLLGFSKTKPKGIKVTIEYCPKNITLPYKVKKLINQASVQVPSSDKCKSKKDPFNFTEKTVRVGEFLNEFQVQHLVDQARSHKNEFESIEIVERESSGPELLID